MCGISGAIYKGQPPPEAEQLLRASLKCIEQRGPDDEGIFHFENTWFGHRRLSIIDTTAKAHQPFSDSTGRYTLIFNGEIFNFQELRNELEKKGQQFISNSDTEVLLYLLISEGVQCLNRLNGFFAFAFHDREENLVYLVRDRYGVKPLYYFADAHRFLFASEIKSLRAQGIPFIIDRVTLHQYLQLNYVPGPWSMLNGVRQVEPGKYLILNTINGKYNAENWYTLKMKLATPVNNYEDACSGLYAKMDAAVQKRLISDVPLGAFLSGGIDSSIIIALAAKETNNLRTFSIGFKDEPHFDETQYARQVALHCGTLHEEFHLSSADLMKALPEVLNYLGEPFADSSALAVYILSRETRKHVTVVLSGDGSDEIFAGYKKHRAEWLLRNYRWMGKVAELVSPIFHAQKGSRQSRSGNILRQLHRFAEGAAMSAADRYWRWCSISSFDQSTSLFSTITAAEIDESMLRANHFTKAINGNEYNEVLLADMHLVLTNDMLVKVDLMSMANSLEVRTPFLDFNVVDYAFSLPSKYKIDREHQKKILKDSFGKLLPPEVFSRRKQGFEIPLLKWLRTDLKPMLDNLFDPLFLQKQGLFNSAMLQQLRNELEHENPGEATSRIWALLVFQVWWINNSNS